MGDPAKPAFQFNFSFAKKEPSTTSSDAKPAFNFEWTKPAATSSAAASGSTEGDSKPKFNFTFPSGSPWGSADGSSRQFNFAPATGSGASNTNENASQWSTTMGWGLSSAWGKSSFERRFNFGTGETFTSTQDPSAMKYGTMSFSFAATKTELPPEPEVADEDEAVETKAGFVEGDLGEAGETLILSQQVQVRELVPKSGETAARWADIGVGELRLLDGPGYSRVVIRRQPPVTTVLINSRILQLTKPKLEGKANDLVRMNFLRDGKPVTIIVRCAGATAPALFEAVEARANPKEGIQGGALTG